MSFVYGTPVGLLQQQITSREFNELLAAERLGLVPDAWLQTGTLAAATYGAAGARIEPEKFRPRRREQLTDQAWQQQQQRDSRRQI